MMRNINDIFVWFKEIDINLQTIIQKLGKFVYLVS